MDGCHELMNRYLTAVPRTVQFPDGVIQKSYSENFTTHRQTTVLESLK